MAGTKAGRAVTIQVTGAAEVRRSMRKAGETTSDLKRPNRRLADEFAPLAAGRAPFVSGRLAGSVKGSSTTTKAIIQAGAGRVPYAGPIHFGWRSRPNPAKGWRGGPIAPNPFIYDVLDERRDEIITAYETYMDQAIREAGL